MFPRLREGLTFKKKKLVGIVNGLAKSHDDSSFHADGLQAVINKTNKKSETNRRRTNNCI